VVGEHRKLAGCLLKSLQLEFGVAGRPFARIGGGRVGIAGGEYVANGGPAGGIIHDDEPPRL
jgi:hypothetical protein